MFLEPVSLPSSPLLSSRLSVPVLRMRALASLDDALEWSATLWNTTRGTSSNGRNPFWRGLLRRRLELTGDAGGSRWQAAREDEAFLWFGGQT